MLNRPTRQIIIAASRAAGVPLDLVHAGIALMDGHTVHRPGHQALLVDQASAARLLSVSRFTIRRMVADGRLHPVRIRGAVRYRRAELESICGDDGRRSSAG